MNFVRKYPLGELIDSNRVLSPSFVSWLIHLLPESQWESTDQRSMFIQAVNQSLNEPLPKASHSGIRKDKRDWSDSIDYRNASDFIPVIYTTYEYAKQAILSHTNYPVTDDINEAYFVLTHLHITNFYDFPQYLRINQFPYEGGLVRKDLLLLTVRGYCYRDNQYPPWWQPAYDLSTEFHYFVRDVKNRFELRLEDDINQSSVDNNWIIKPSQGTRAVGHHILLDPIFRGRNRNMGINAKELVDDMLMEAALMSPRVSYSDSTWSDIVTNALSLIPSSNTRLNRDKLLGLSSSDRIVQLLIDRPLLVRGLKFDLRTYVFVRSFEPFEVYVHRHHYGRLANKSYALEDLDDNEVVLTVNAYNDNEEIAAKQRRIFRSDLRMELMNENPLLDYDAMMQTMIDMFTDLFRGAASSVGEWPASSAYYAVDVMFDCKDAYKESSNTFIPQAKLLEVNFMGDMEAAWLGSSNDTEYKEWINDLIICLATKQEPHPERHTRLR